jgi:hypothetical protein
MLFSPELEPMQDRRKAIVAPDSEGFFDIPNEKPSFSSFSTGPA